MGRQLGLARGDVIFLAGGFTWLEWRLEVDGGD